MTIRNPELGLWEQFERVGKPLGRGGMGVVYKVMDRKTGKEYALKLVDFSKITNWETTEVQEIEREAQALKAITHPNVVGYVDSFKEDVGYGPGMHILMELIRGISAQQAMKEGSHFSAEQLERFFFPAIHGLQAAHKQGIYHRDPTPHNIMLEVTEQYDRFDFTRVVLTDFGIARLKQHGTGSETIIGKPNYLAPEQRKNMNRDDDTHTIPTTTATDWYILALATKAIATHIEPPLHIPGQYDYDPIKYVRRAPNISEPLKKTLEACLQEEQHDRPQTVDNIQQVFIQSGGNLGFYNPTTGIYEVAPSEEAMRTFAVEMVGLTTKLLQGTSEQLPGSETQKALLADGETKSKVPLQQERYLVPENDFDFWNKQIHDRLPPIVKDWPERYKSLSFAQSSALKLRTRNWPGLIPAAATLIGGLLMGQPSIAYAGAVVAYLGTRFIQLRHKDAKYHSLQQIARFIRKYQKGSKLELSHHYKHFSKQGLKIIMQRQKNILSSHIANPIIHDWVIEQTKQGHTEAVYDCAKIVREHDFDPAIYNSAMIGLLMQGEWDKAVVLRNRTVAYSWGGLFEGKPGDSATAIRDALKLHKDTVDELDTYAVYQLQQCLDRLHEADLAEVQSYFKAVRAFGAQEMLDEYTTSLTQRLRNKNEPGNDQHEAAYERLAIIYANTNNYNGAHGLLLDVPQHNISQQQLVMDTLHQHGMKHADGAIIFRARLLRQMRLGDDTKKKEIQQAREKLEQLYTFAD